MGNAAIVLLLLGAGAMTTTAASAADLRDVREPAKIQAVFPHAAKLHVVNIWATWCVPCVAEIPELRAISAAFGPELAMVGVSMDDMIPGAKRESTIAFLDEQHVRYINLYYRGNADDLARYFRFDGEIPVTIVFDAAGHEVWRHQGAIRRTSAIPELRKLLSRRAS